jgi:hypothetical protein
MQQDDQVSRYEVNRSVRMVFTRHDADMTRIDYSFMGSTVYLYGDLARPDGDFSPQEMEAMARELSALPHVRDIQFNLDNWLVLSSGDSWKISLTRKSHAPKAARQTGTLADSTVVVEKAEDLEVVIDDISKGSAKGKKE